MLSISSALICALLTVQVYVASGSHIRSRLGRIAVAMPVLLAPVAENPAKSDVVVRGAPKQFWSHVIIPCRELRGLTELNWLDPPG